MTPRHPPRGLTTYRVRAPMIAAVVIACAFLVEWLSLACPCLVPDSILPCRLAHLLHNLTPALMGFPLLLRCIITGFTWPNHISYTVTTQKPERRILAYADYGALSITTSDCSLDLIYYSWVGATYGNQIAQLPSGLILKWSDGAPLEEVLAMQVARRAGLPVRRVICYGEHPGRPHAPVSIPMTRILGDELGRVYKTLTDVERDSSLLQLNG